MGMADPSHCPGPNWKVLKSVCPSQGLCVWLCMRALHELSSQVLQENIGILFIVIFNQHLYFYNA